MAAAHEATTDAELEEWHDQAFAEYQEALDEYMAGGVCPEGHTNPLEAAYCSTCGAELPEHDPDTKAAYEEARDNLSAGTQYWRQVGEELGIRTGVVVEDDTL